MDDEECGVGATQAQRDPGHVRRRKNRPFLATDAVGLESRAQRSRAFDSRGVLRLVWCGEYRRDLCAGRPLRSWAFLGGAVCVGRSDPRLSADVHQRVSQHGDRSRRRSRPSASDRSRRRLTTSRRNRRLRQPSRLPATPIPTAGPGPTWTRQSGLRRSTPAASPTGPRCPSTGAPAWAPSSPTRR